MMNQYHKINLSNIFFISWIDFLVQFPYDFFLGVFDPPPPIKKTRTFFLCSKHLLTILLGGPFCSVYFFLLNFIWKKSIF